MTVELALHILRGTPAWVYLFFAFVVWRGIGSLHTRTMPMWRTLTVPALFIGVGLVRLVDAPEQGAWSLLAWIGGALLGAALATIRPPELLAADRRTGLIIRAESVVPLLRNIVNFGLQYAAAIMAARALGHNQLLSAAARVLSGASAGYFLGWAMLLLRCYRQGPQPGVERAPAGSR